MKTQKRLSDSKREGSNDYRTEPRLEATVSIIDWTILMNGVALYLLRLQVLTISRDMWM